MNSTYQDTLVSYILILCLRLENWTMEYDDIAKDLGVSDSA